MPLRSLHLGEPGSIVRVNLGPTLLARVRDEHVGYLADAPGFGGVEANDQLGSRPNALGDTRRKLIEHHAAECAAVVLDRQAVAVVYDGRDDVALEIRGRRFALSITHARDSIRSPTVTRLRLPSSVRTR